MKESFITQQKEDKFRYINAVTRKDVYLIPRIVDKLIAGRNTEMPNFSTRRIWVLPLAGYPSETDQGEEQFGV